MKTEGDQKGLNLPSHSWTLGRGPLGKTVTEFDRDVGVRNVPCSDYKNGGEHGFSNRKPPVPAGCHLEVFSHLASHGVSTFSQQSQPGLEYKSRRLSPSLPSAKFSN